MKHFALIGERLGHSWSQRWFNDLFARLGLEGYTYVLKELPSLDGLRRWVEDECIDGFNVTVPYKRAVIPHLDALSPEAEAIGAVNCVCVSGRRLIGHNTDSPAFEQTFAPLASGIGGAVVVLGTGGAARAVGHALQQLGREHVYVSRNPSQSNLSTLHSPLSTLHSPLSTYPEAARLHPRFNILVNATPVGMWPNIGATPWDMPLHRFRLVYDLIYNPSPTLLLRRAEESGAAVSDGLAMLHRQAELSWQLWQ